VSSAEIRHQAHEIPTGYLRSLLLIICFRHEEEEDFA